MKHSEQTIEKLVNCKNFLKQLFTEGYFENDEVTLEIVRTILARCDEGQQKDLNNTQLLNQDDIDIEHELIRPPENYYDVERWTGSQWIADDSKPGICFSGLQYGHGLMGTPIAWYPKCSCSMMKNKCPKNISMERTVNNFKCANGKEII